MYTHASDLWHNRQRYLLTNFGLIFINKLNIVVKLVSSGIYTSYKLQVQELQDLKDVN
jgi:hypothetical protein